MLRRHFVAGIGGLVLAPCCRQSSATGKKRTGCWLKATDGALQREGLQQSSGNAEIDAFCRTEAKRLDEVFGLKTELKFFDDRDAPNAFATRDRAYTDNPDGVVFVGVSLASDLMAKFRPSGGLPLVGVLAHEWGHLLQFSKGFDSNWDVRFELSADYLAGWYLARTRKDIEKRSDDVANLFASLGSTTLFADPDYHGSPKQRSRTLLNGARLYGLSVGDSGVLTTDAREALSQSGANFGSVRAP